MIRIKVTKDQLEKAIDRAKPTWRTGAKNTREHNRSKRCYDRATPNWSGIKPVYMALQNGKCAYCERRLAPSDPEHRLEFEKQPWRYAAYEFDVEHFRPKNAIEAWPTEKIAKDRGLDYGELTISSGTKDVGYYLLSHDVLNYTASCKPCNSGLKSNYFPVAASHNTTLEDPSDWPDEWPYLIHPLADLDTDPADLLEFIGVTPRPVVKDKSLHDHWRGRITIDFFDLTHESLARERAHCIVTLYLAFKVLANSAPDAVEHQLATDIVTAYTADSAPHSMCAKAYKTFYAKDPDQATDVAKHAGTLVSRDAGE